MPLQVRRGPTADRLLITPVEGELILDTTENTLFIGDGVTPGGVAASDFSFEDAQDAAAALFTSGIHPNVTFTYNDQANRIDTVLNLRNYNGVIEADAFQGSLFSDNSTLLVDGILGSINLDGTIRSDLIPVASEVYDIGSPTAKFKDLYLSGSSLWIGDAQVTAVGSAINLPVGSTVNGVAIGTGNGNGEIAGDGVVEGSNYRINIIGDDSTVIVDSSNNSINAPGGILGDLTGDLTGDIVTSSGKIIYDIIGNEFNMRNIKIGTNEFDSSTSTLNIDNSGEDSGTNVVINSNKRGTSLKIRYKDESQTIPTSTTVGIIQFEKNDQTGIQASSIIASSVDRLVFIQLTPGESPSGDKTFRLTQSGNFSIGNITSPTFKLEVDGNARVVTNLSVGSFLQFGSLTTTERNELTAVNGMVIYNTTNNKFEGYQNNGWINLDDGNIAAE